MTMPAESTIARLGLTLSRALSLFTALMLFALMWITLADVIGRDLFQAPILGAFEITEVMMGIVVFSGLPQVTMTDGHVAVTLLDGFLGPMARNVQRALVNLVCAGVLVLMAWQLWETADTMASYNDISLFLEIPLAPTAYFMAVMTGLCVPIILVMTFTGPVPLNRIIGTEQSSVL